MSKMELDAADRLSWRRRTWLKACAALNVLWATSLGAQTVAEAVAASEGARAPAAHGRIWLTFGLDRIPLLRGELLGNPIWQYLASLLYIILAFYASKVLDYLIQVQLRKWAARTATKFDDLLLDLLRGPVKIVSFVVLLHVGLRLFAWPEWEANLTSSALKIVVGCSLTYLALKVVDLGMGLWQQRVEGAQIGLLDLQLFPIIRKAFKIFVIVVAVLVVSQNLGMNVTGLLASLSIGGLAVGLAAQDTLSNLFGAVAIFADKPFRLGDSIQLDSLEGTVEAIGLRSTRVRSGDGFLITIPNKTMAAANIVNISKRPRIKTQINLGVSYDTPAPKIERALAIIREVFQSHPKTADLLVTFNRFDSASLNILVVHWWNSTDFKEYVSGLEQLNLELKRRLDDEKISIGLPRQTIYIRQEAGWRPADAVKG